MSDSTLIVAGGCFWCTEAVFEQLAGVGDVTSGYSGGTAEDANYTRVCQGDTGHAEAIRIRFDAAVISRRQLLEVFFHIAHDPTQLNRQGNDIGTQYRSAVFYQSDDEKREAQALIDELNASGDFDAPIATRLEAFDAFYPAEDYHQDFARQNPLQPYVFCVAKPKLKKLKQHYPQWLGDKNA